MLRVVDKGLQARLEPVDRILFHSPGVTVQDSSRTNISLLVN